MLADKRVDVTALKSLFANRTLQLALITVTSWLLYFFGLTQPYTLLAESQNRFSNLGNTVGFQPLSEARFALVFAVGFLLYWLGLRIVRATSNRTLWTIVIMGSLAFNLSFLAMRPFDSSDIFDNIIRGRMQAVYHANPFYQTPNTFKQDPFFKYTYWTGTPSAYGPWWEVPAAGVAWLAGDDLTANILAFKLLAMAAYAITIALIALATRRTSRHLALRAVVFFAWNPIVLYSVAGNAHNDVVMAMFVVLGLYWFIQGHYTLAAMAETAGALVKFIPVLLIPVIVIAGIQHLVGWKARLRYVLITMLSCSLLVVASYAPFWRGGDVMGISRRTTLFTTSLPTLLRNALSSQLGETQADQIAAYAALAVLIGWAVWTLWWQWKKSEKDAPMRAGASLLLFYLLVSCLWFHAWYVIWPLAVVALLPESLFATGAILLSIGASAQSPIFHWVLVRGTQQLPPREWLDGWLTTLTLGLPWLFFLYTGARTIVSRLVGVMRQKKGEPMRKALIVVAKRPAQGETKTRLCPPLSSEQAAQLYECFMQDTLETMRRVADVTRLVAYLPDSAEGYFEQIAPGFRRMLQEGANLGERLDHALTACLQDGYNQAVIMDSDSPTLPADFLARAFVALEHADVVLGPCEDGGYYLIGMNRSQSRLLREVQMSTANVLNDTLALAEEEGLRVALLPVWYDVDTSAELDRLIAELASSTNHTAPYTRAFLKARGR